MSLRLLPDIEKLVIDYLLSIDEVDDIVDGRIGSKKDAPYPRLVIGRVSGSPGPIPAHLDSARLQVEAWTDLPADGGSKPAAALLARTTIAALYEMVNVTHDEGVVTDVEVAMGPQWLPDPTTSRPRYVFDVIVRVHPFPSS